jgi:hypothetical protein
MSRPSTLRIAAAFAALALSTGAAASSAAPPAPKKLAVEEVAETDIQLSWKDRSVNETSFEIWVRKDPETEWKLLGSVGSNVTSFTSETLERATTYEFRVAAVNGSGSTLAKDTVFATTLE